MKTIDTGCFGIKVKLAGKGGTITSDLHEKDEGAGYKAAIDTLESLVLAHACAGIDVTSPAYLEGVETAANAIFNEFDNE